MKRDRGKGEHGQVTPHSCIYLFIYLEQPQISINSRYYFKTIRRLIITGLKKKESKSEDETRNMSYARGRAKTVLQIFNKSSQSKTSTKHFSFSEYKCKKENFLSLFRYKTKGYGEEEWM